jgi:hypothetical protein
LKKHRIATTVSEKHWEILKKHAEKFETQQKALELALECLESSSKQRLALTEEEKFWMCVASNKAVCTVHKDFLKMLMETADIELHKEYVTRNKPIEYIIEYHLQKPLKECSLNEVINAIVFATKMSHWFDTVDYMDDGGHYTLIITHSLGFNNSKIIQVLHESVFKTYGVETKSEISEKTIFMKILKTGN